MPFTIASVVWECSQNVATEAGITLNETIPRNHSCWSRGILCGAACENRTRDLLITSEMLYRLS